MTTVLLFVLFGGLAVGCAVSMVAQRNPLYSAVSLVGVFVALACLYMMMNAPFIAAVQVIVYAGAIMVLVVFVIMLLNVEEEARRPVRLYALVPIALVLAALLAGEAAFLLTLRGASNFNPTVPNAEVGLTRNIGTGLFTEYLLPFEVTSVLILMALVGAITLARQASVARPEGPADFGPRGGGGLALVEPADEGGTVQPGRTGATGRAMAEAQIAAGDAAAPARKGGGEEGQGG